MLNLLLFLVSVEALNNGGWELMCFIALRFFFFFASRSLYREPIIVQSYFCLLFPAAEIITKMSVRCNISCEITDSNHFSSQRHAL